MQIIYDGISEIGLERQINQDAIGLFQKEDMILLCLADGMGGHEQGECASAAIVEAMQRWTETFEEDRYQKKFGRMLNDMVKEVQKVNLYIYKTYNQNQITGSTMLLLLIYKDEYAVLSIGDSRVYQKKKWKYELITVDDVWENQDEIKNHYSKQEILSHENYGKLMHACGIKDEVMPEVKFGRLQPDMKFLMCSDGLTKVCKESKIKKMIAKSKSKESIKQSLNVLKDEVYKNGAPDNVSILILSVLKD